MCPSVELEGYVVTADLGILSLQHDVHLSITEQLSVRVCLMHMILLLTMCITSTPNIHYKPEPLMHEWHFSVLGLLEPVKCVCKLVSYCETIQQQKRNTIIFYFIEHWNIHKN